MTWIDYPISALTRLPWSPCCTTGGLIPGRSSRPSQPCGKGKSLSYVWPSLRRSCKRTFPLNMPHVCAGMQGTKAARRLLLPGTTARAATAWGLGPRRRSRPAPSSIHMRPYPSMVGSADTGRSDVGIRPGTAGHPRRVTTDHAGVNCHGLRSCCSTQQVVKQWHFCSSVLGTIGNEHPGGAVSLSTDGDHLL